MWKKFHEENYGRKVVENDKGYIVFKIYDDKSAYIHIAYIKPEFRYQGHIATLENQIIKEYDVHTLFCYIDLTSDTRDQAMKAIFKNGYSIDTAYSDRISMFKKVV